MGISQSGFQVIVTKQFLYETDVCAGLQEMGGKTVSQTHCDRSCMVFGLYDLSCKVSAKHRRAA